MKSSSLILFSLLSTVGAHAQSKIESPKVSKNTHLQVFEEARNRGDFSTAIVSLNYLLSSNDSLYAPYQDTLARYYVNAGLYVQGLQIIEKLLVQKPTDESLLSYKAVSLRMTNQKAKSAEIFDFLYNSTSNYVYGLELAQMQWDLKRILECQQTCQSLRKQKFKEDVFLQVPVANTQTTEQVTVPAYAWYMEGMTFLEINQGEKAKQAFEQALKLSSPFTLVSQQLQKLTKVGSDTKLKP